MGRCVAPSNVQADKEFVWSLWKQLQTESPDIASAVDMVITRYCKQINLELLLLSGYNRAHLGTECCSTGKS